MNSELTLNLQDLENLFTKSNCSCHFINPNKTRIILWKERSYNSELSPKEVKANTVTYYLRLGIQKFISYPLTDKNGETYWRFKVWEREPETPTELSLQETSTTPDPDPITKFNQRQAQTKSYGKPDHTEPAVNHSHAN